MTQYKNLNDNTTTSKKINETRKETINKPSRDRFSVQTVDTKREPKKPKEERN